MSQERAAPKGADIGVYGLGTMGSALALNFAEKGFDVAVSNLEPDWIEAFLPQAAGFKGHVSGHTDLAAFVAGIAQPRTILCMIPSTGPMDAMIDALRPLLDAGDTIIDGGNADFNDTRRRAAQLEGTGLNFVGMGVSGGSEGARHGPAMMVGGPVHAWQQFRPMAEAIAAKFEGVPCVAHVGPDGAGHFVKTVHNGIEYADMQMISELYALMRDGREMAAAEIGAVFTEWNTGPLASYLIEIAGAVLSSTDRVTGAPMVDFIKDQAGQKGTGRWTLIEALKMRQSASTIEAAVGARGWSSEYDVRQAAAEALSGGAQEVTAPSVQDMEDAMQAARILGHAQGLRILQAASEEFDWALDLAQIAEIWRAGCIIRSALLDEIAKAVRAGLPHGHLLLAPQMAARLAQTIPGLRRVVAAAVLQGYPVPALAAALSWHDTMTQARGSANMIQGLRDYFGNHGFERLSSDQDGADALSHGDWTPIA